MDADAVEAVAHVAVDAEDALDVHVALDGRLDRAELDAAILGDRGDAGREAAREPDEQELDRRHAVVLGGEDLRVVGIEGGFGAVLLLGAEAEEVRNLRAAVGAAQPFVRRPPRELRAFRRRGQRLAGAEQCLRH